MQPGIARHEDGSRGVGGRIAGVSTGLACARPAGRCAAAAAQSHAPGAVGTPAPTRLALRPAGPAHGRSDRRRATSMPASSSSPGAPCRDRRPLALRLRAADPGLGRGALRLRLAAPPARRRHRARPGQRPLPRRRVHLDAGTATARSPARPQVAGAAADLVPQPVAAHPRRARTTPSTSAFSGHRPARCAISSATCGPTLAGRRRLTAAIASAMRGLCCEGLDGRCGARPGFLPASSTARSCRTAAMRAAIRASWSSFCSTSCRCARCSPAGPSTPPEALLRAIDRMLPMLRLFRHRDGTLAHFNGMGVTAADHLATLLTYDDMRSQPIQHAPHSGYERLEAGRSLVVADVGAARRAGLRGGGRRELPLLRVLERAQRIIVNCGAAAGGERSRSSRRRAQRAAHSTAAMGDASSTRFLSLQGFWFERRLARLAPVAARTGRARRAARGDRRARRARRRPDPRREP